MTLFLPVNDVSTTLAASASSTATTLTLSSMANLPASIPSGMVIPFTVTTAVTAANREIVYATAISASNITVIRAQENTSAQNWNAGDSIFVAVTAGLLQSFANISGNSSQVFNVAAATTSTEAIPLAQAFQMVVPTGTQTISLAALNTLVMPSLAAAATMTMAPGASDGQKCRVTGGEYAVTIASNVASGSPQFIFPDETADYSWTIPAGQFGAFIDLIWDSVNWRVSTGGETIVANATGANQAVALGQANSLYMPIGETIVNTFNGRNGSVSLSSGDVTNALTYIPATLNGSNSEQFNVANATAATEAVALGQFTSSLGAAGWLELPNGIILQWGTGTVTATGTGNFSATATLPEAFPSAGLFAIGNWGGSNPPGGGSAFPFTTFPNATQVTLGIYAPGAGTFTIAYLAIGH